MRRPPTPAPRLACIGVVLALACTSEAAPADEGGASTGTAQTMGPDDSGDDPSDPDGSDTDVATANPTDSDPGTEGGVEGGVEDDGGEGDEGEPPPANEPNLPTPTGPCPDFLGNLTGSQDLVFSPEGRTPRSVRLLMNETVLEQDGPLIFYWHGTGGDSNESTYGLGSAAINQVRNAGGIIASPFADPASGTYPWQPVGGNVDHDNVLADEILACAIEQVGIDTHRIHSAGFSAGGIHTVTMGARRSAYLASVVSFSGGLFGAVLPTETDADNLFAAMIIHGGTADVFQGQVSFQGPSEYYAELLQQGGRTAILCDHGAGHSVPAAIHAPVLQFFSDHPWGTSPSPYENGFPAAFSAGYCQIP